MPHIRVRGMAFEDLEYISASLIKSLAKYLDLPGSHFTLEYQNVTYLATEGASKAYPFFEVLCFKRSDKVKAGMAKLITELVKANIEPELDICVLFQTMASDDYYHSGQS